MSVADMLIKHNAKLHALDGEGRTPLEYARFYGNMIDISGWHAEQ